MQARNPFKQPLFIIGIAATALSLMIILFLILDQLNQDSNTKSAVTLGSQTSQDLTDGKPVNSAQCIAFPIQASSGFPLRLKIPKINVDTALVSVGLTPDGDMDIPKTPDAVAWFEPGPYPGDNGSAVIAGHYGRWENGEGSAFDDLNKLRKGDSLSVEDEKGTTTTFVVREIRLYKPEDDASGVFGSNDGKAHLNLITCTGDWDNTEKSFSNRLVVFTDKETDL